MAINKSRAELEKEKEKRGMKKEEKDGTEEEK